MYNIFEKQMKTIFLIVALVALFLDPCSAMSQSWSNWILPNWTPDWPFVGPWIAPSDKTTGFTRVVYTTTTDPNYSKRYTHYLWLSADKKLGLACAPESYLDSNLNCVKNPKYWDLSNPNVKPYCAPILIKSGIIQVSNTIGKCYDNTNADLSNISILSTLYPVGA